MVTAISYDGFDLNNSTYRSIDLNPMGSPDKDTTMLRLARADGSLRVFQSYDSKTLTLTGRIISDTKVNLELAIDALKMQMRRESGNLQYDWGNGVRIHKCTAKKVSCDKGPGELSTAPFQIVFECESPFATDGVTDTIVNNQNISASPTNFNIAINGTYDARPVLTFSIVAINPTVTASQITIGNATNSQYLTVEDIFTAGDVLVIDCDNSRVFHNGIFIKSIGQFPYFAAGNGVLEYTDNCVTRNINLTATAERRYL